MPDGRSKRKDSVDELDELDAALNPARNYPRKRVAVAAPSGPLTLRPRAYADGWRSYYQHTLSVPHYDFSFRQTAGEAVTARPSFVSFTCPYYIQFDSWDDTQNFYDDEMTAEEQLYAAMDANTTPDPELSSRITWRLQQSFVKNYLQWYPLIEPDVLVQHVQVAQAGHFLETNPSNCLTMFAFAIGTEAESYIVWLLVQEEISQFFNADSSMPQTSYVEGDWRGSYLCTRDPSTVCRVMNMLDIAPAESLATMHQDLEEQFMARAWLGPASREKPKAALIRKLIILPTRPPQLENVNAYTCLAS
ncbi:hypothetical protein H2199_005682 [Coniosporium tulheliwenetii]|uniref:Uncharacterized protein n=1 Tax=Coniosporium tulheliwenetii TaxID=3383036 RepID=A0ACC2YZZ0_9PEZI|nr:hypothetical protein H2199_005682 [Cladosporium sp. JES 115]